MDFSLLIFLIIAWTIFSKVKGAGKGLAKAAQKGESAKETLAKAHAKLREAAARDEFEVSPELRPGYRQKSNQSSISQPWGEMTPTQRGRERARQKESYRSGSQHSQQSLQQRLSAANTAANAVRKVAKVRHREFKQGSERKVSRQKAGRGKDFGLSSRHAPQKDQNRHRRDDWGQRGGGEIITTKSLLFLLGLGTIVLYVLSKVSPSDLGF